MLFTRLVIPAGYLVLEGSAAEGLRPGQIAGPLAAPPAVPPLAADAVPAAPEPTKAGEGIQG
jgi:hypothetical protein